MSCFGVIDFSHISSCFCLLLKICVHSCVRCWPVDNSLSIRIYTNHYKLAVLELLIFISNLNRKRIWVRNESDFQNSCKLLIFCGFLTWELLVPNKILHLLIAEVGWVTKRWVISESFEGQIYSKIIGKIYEMGVVITIYSCLYKTWYSKYFYSQLQTLKTDMLSTENGNERKTQDYLYKHCARKEMGL